ncbi:uncharacterized protein TNCV_1287221 [Trichonephila clavipes]|nr:uncharacterized protein TNCV_1287221 [Trichonephila clavipes]
MREHLKFCRTKLSLCVVVMEKSFILSVLFDCETPYKNNDLFSHQARYWMGRGKGSGRLDVVKGMMRQDQDLESEVNEDDIEELTMGHEDELTTEELLEILNEEHQETQRNVSPSEQEEDERGPMPTSAIKDLLKKWADVRLAPKPS